MLRTICAHSSEDSGDWFCDERQRRIFIVSLGQRPRTHVTREIASAESAIHSCATIESDRCIGPRFQRLLPSVLKFPGAMPQARHEPAPLAPTDAIDLSRCRANFHVAVAKTKRAGLLTLLGHADAKLPASPEEARLETFPNPAPQRNYRIHFETDDFTSVCPVTGQPDFARIDIDYVPDRLCVESKSLKFYLASYRNQRAFNEAVTNRILDDFVKACAPREAIVTAQFSARGGIALTVRAEYPDKK